MKRSPKILFPKKLAALLRKRQARGERIVFTNGVYDLIHAGHVSLLQKARALGERLVVGINSDASVRRLKGPMRPIAPLGDRAEVLAALEPVDYVTWFDEDTPYELIARLKPDILVKGGDYPLHKIVGRELVKKVVRVPLLQGRSTSALIKKVLKAHGR